MNIIAFKGKHATVYYVASTPEERRAAMWSELKDREGWYPFQDEPRLKEEDKDIVLMAEEDFNALPETVQKSLIGKRQRYQAEKKTCEENNDFAAVVASLVSLPVEEAVQQQMLDRRGRPIYTLDYVLDMTQDREYEEWFIERVREPLQ